MKLLEMQNGISKAFVDKGLKIPVKIEKSKQQLMRWNPTVQFDNIVLIMDSLLFLG